MADRDYKAFIVEGEVREPIIIDNVKKVFFSHSNFKIITLPVGMNIYMLWKKLKDDDFDTDIIEVLREEHKDLEKQLTGLDRDDFSEVYLFFDYDGHQDNLGSDEDCDVLEQMLTSFNNETENGKLYISYPMVEALRDFETGACRSNNGCYISLKEIHNYKSISSTQLMYQHFNSYNFNVWKALIEVFSMRISCLVTQHNTVSYEQYTETIYPYTIYDFEKREIQDGKVFILSAFPEFLLDYFGIKLWKTCVKHAKNMLGQQECDKGLK